MRLSDEILSFKATNNTVQTNHLAAAFRDIYLEAPNWQQLGDLFVIV